jgi:arabinofuranan 3-O-arabinosyltransferase
MSRRLLGLIVLAALATAAAPRIVREMPDFEVYWRAGARTLAAQPLYRAEDGHYQNKYLPAFGILVSPLARLPLLTAKYVWFYLSVAVIAALMFLSLELLPTPKVMARTLVILTTLAMLKFYARELNLGQDNALMAMLAMYGLALLMNGREIAAGLVLALAVVVKPYAIVFLPYVILRRRVRAAQWMVIGLWMAIVLPAATYGWNGNGAQFASWARTVSESTPDNLLNPDNVSIWAMYARWLGVGPLAFWLAALTIGAMGLVFLIVLAQGRAIRDREYLEVAMLLAALPLLSPQGWDYVLLMATPAVMLIFNELRELPLPIGVLAGSSVAVMALTVFDLMGRRAYAAFMATSAISVCALMLVGTVAVVRLRRAA